MKNDNETSKRSDRMYAVLTILKDTTRLNKETQIINMSVKNAFANTTQHHRINAMQCDQMTQRNPTIRTTLGNAVSSRN